MSKAEKMFSLFSILPQKPREFYDRVAAVIDVQLESYFHEQPHYQAGDWDTVLGGLNQSLRANLEDCMREPALHEIEKAVREGLAAMPSDAPFASHHNGDFYLGKLCYALTRIKRPQTIVETGVCYGVTSSFILKALEVNGAGRLHSIDLPPLGKNQDHFVGWLIPQTLRTRWKLYRGSSKAVLPKVLEGTGKIDFFIHDSLHTYRNMRREFEMAAPYLAPGSVVVADDVEGNAAFQEWIAKVTPAYAAVLQEQSKRQSLLGVAVYDGFSL